MKKNITLIVLSALLLSNNIAFAKVARSGRMHLHDLPETIKTMDYAEEQKAFNTDKDKSVPDSKEVEEAKEEWGKSTASRSCSLKGLKEEGELYSINATCNEGTKFGSAFRNEQTLSFALNDIKSLSNCKGNLRVGDC